ncbi:hypothetical protein DDZ14_07310, partial [Maritimibacter sp. 55A14]|uniref:hypothetical protein n=1 Tax=Maritimibacter sp. 55A14 TaxID=2174844 RepID=UPI000D620BA2
WWSVRPSDAGGADLVERACRQVAGVAADIARDCAHIGQDRLCSVDYEALCAAPERTLAAVAEYLERHGLPAAPRAGVPGAFALHPSRPLEADREARLQAQLAALGVSA